jgi:hypothetical protein
MQEKQEHDGCRRGEADDVRETSACRQKAGQRHRRDQHGDERIGNQPAEKDNHDAADSVRAPSAGRKRIDCGEA